jgi:hypothetical protein
MINVDLSKATSPRFFVYLLALFPGLFFLLSVVVGNPQLAKAAIQQMNGVYPFPPYGLLLILVGSGFVIGDALILFSWLERFPYYCRPSMQCLNHADAFSGVI